MGTILEYATLADAAYRDEPNVGGWTRVAFKPTGSGLTDALQAAAYTKGGEMVFAFKGTNPSDVRDLIADLKLGIGMDTYQFSEAQRFVANTPLGSANRVTITGHSLGGAIAQVVGNRLEQRFVTFNAPGVALFSRNIGETATTFVTGTAWLRLAGNIVSTALHPMQAAEDLGDLFNRARGVNFRVGMDLVGIWGVHYGRVIMLDYDGSGLNVYDKHLMTAVIPSLEESQYGNVSLQSLLNNQN